MDASVAGALVVESTVVGVDVEDSGAAADVDDAAAVDRAVELDSESQPTRLIITHRPVATVRLLRFMAEH